MSRTMIWSVLFSCVAAVGCGKPVVFQGESTFAVAAAPPAPPAPPPRVEVRDNKIEITEKIQFEHDKATIMPVSFDLLNEIASVIQTNPHIKKIQIEGHASAEGDAAHNQTLSEQRASAVLTYLTSKGIAQGVLASRGFGIDKPIADNDTEPGREQNRRVEFNILEQDVTTQPADASATLTPPSGQPETL